jgi:hypothetical protein
VNIRHLIYIIHFPVTPIVLILAPILFRFRRCRIPVVVAVGLTIPFAAGAYRFFVPAGDIFLVVGFLELVIFGLWSVFASRKTPLPKWTLLVPVLAALGIGLNAPYVWYAAHHREKPWVRGIVGRAKAEIRNLAVNLEDYYIDHNTYPPPVDLEGNIIPFEASENGISAGYVPWMLTTPKAYTMSIPWDPFHWREKVGEGPYRYATNGLKCWIMTSRGPDMDDDIPIEQYPVPEIGACKFRQFMS